MRLFVSKLNDRDPVGRNIFLDNDFLSFIANDEEIFEETLAVFPDGILIIDPIIKIEFLQTTFLHKQREIKEKLISNTAIFGQVIEHPTYLEKVRENALTLSYLYAHNNIKGASTPDLLLAGRVLLYPSSLLITGNKKHFPSVIFETVCVLNAEDEKAGQMRPFSVLKFDQGKFNKAHLNWKKVEK